MSTPSALDVVWLLACSGLVFLMQAGFLCLESGLTRSKNAINVALKNLTDFAVVVLLFWLFGFGLMFGASAGGWLGTTHFMRDETAGGEHWVAAFFLFQVMFCATASTIVSGAVAERMRFSAYLVATVLVGGLIYPVFGHWAWGGLLGGPPGWLAALGFVDFAGSTVVHSVGGWVSLAAVLRLGPREGRFPQGEAPRVMLGGDLPMSMLGVLLLAFGWFGFNGGSTLVLDARVPGVLVNTFLAAAGGSVAGLALGWRRQGYAEVLYAMNGMIAGLVAVTASAHAVSSGEAVLIGAVGGMLMVWASETLLRLRIDDAVGSIPVHLAAGVWGTLAVGLFGDAQALGTGLSRLDQIGVQLFGAAVCGLWSFGMAWLLLRGIGRLTPLRVSPRAEAAGLNESEHGARSELNALVDAMNEQALKGDLNLRVPADSFSEVGQIAACYNRVMDHLEQAVGRTQAVIRDMREGVMTFTREGILTSFNPGAERLLDIPAQVAVGSPLGVVLQPDGSGERTAALLQPGQRLELSLRQAGGTGRVLELTTSESRIGGGLQLTGIVRDITERKAVEAQLHRERDLAQVTLASIGDGVITTDDSGMVQYLNPVAERLSGWSSAEARGLPIGAIQSFSDGQTGAPLPNPVHDALRQGRSVQRHEHALLHRRDGSTVALQYTAAPIRSREGYTVGGVLVLHDVTVALHLTRELSHQARHDALTGLPNRREFEHRLGALLGRRREDGESHVVGYLDLDQFKIVNDTCGHTAGDELLRQVSALLRSRMRGSDLLARLGGDEFGIVLFNCPIARAQALADGMRAAVEDYRFAWEGRSFGIGVSIGLVAIEPADASIAETLSAVDAACYAAKESGRNRVHIYHPHDDRLLEKQGQMQWVGRLRAALDEDRLRLFVQPIVGLGEGAQARHMEVLVRLEEDGRLISPGAFLPAAERYNLMPQLDHWVVSNALSWLGDVVRATGGVPATFCINLSGASLSDERFRATVRALLQRLDLPRGAVCFEITENAAVANLSKVVEFIAELRQLGCSFALDDFGSGLSSFAYLKNLPVDYLKIDGSFVKDIERDPIDLAMVQAIHTIGHVMGLKTVAEFVENAAILDKLREIGVDYAQGYHLGKPRPLEQLGGVRRMPR